nr:immunoglobulin light chain junction region [Macaca mulatta]MOV85414.1 immunoglobulin light chain junction region [Macaca mulatta]
CLQGYYSPYNF